MLNFCYWHIQQMCHKYFFQKLKTKDLIVWLAAYLSSPHVPKLAEENEYILLTFETPGG